LEFARAPATPQNLVGNFFIPFLKCVTKAKRSETPKTLLQLKNTIEQRGSPKLTLKIDNGTIVPKEILILLDCGKYCTKS
jgi:hypothetical protein